MKNVRKAKPAKAKAPQVLPAHITIEIEVAHLRLRRAQDVLSALAYCADEGAELDLGPVAVAARDQIDAALAGLASISAMVSG